MVPSSIVHLVLLSGVLVSAEQDPNCPMVDSVPGYSFLDISVLGVAALVDAVDDVDGFLQIGCNPNFNGTYVTFTNTKCSSPLLTRLGVSCVREDRIEGITPLNIAANMGSVGVIKKLLKISNIDVDAQDTDGNTALFDAAAQGNLKIVKLLTEAGANINMTGGPNKVSPIAIAAEKGHLKMVEFLIKQRADINQKGLDGDSPIYLAAQYGNTEIIRTLHAAGAIIGLANMEAISRPNQFSPLITSILGGHTKTTILLFQLGASTDGQTVSGATPVFAAAQEGDLAVLTALYEAGADLETPGGAFSITPLGIAADKGQEDVLDDTEQTDMSLDREKGNDRKFQLLVKGGAV